MPPGFAAEKCKDGPENGDGSTSNSKDKSGNQPVSKASTVEMAIDYIKLLRSELDETKERLKAAEMKNESVQSKADNEQPNEETKQQTSS